MLPLVSPHPDYLHFYSFLNKKVSMFLLLTATDASRGTFVQAGNLDVRKNIGYGNGHKEAWVAHEEL